MVRKAQRQRRKQQQQQQQQGRSSTCGSSEGSCKGCLYTSGTFHVPHVGSVPAPPHVQSYAQRRADGQAAEGLVPWGAKPDVLIDRYDVRSLLDMYIEPDPR